MPFQCKCEPLTSDEANRLATKSRAETLPFSYSAAAMAVAHFRLAYYRFVLKATTDIQLPPYKGSSFRRIRACSEAYGLYHARKRMSFLPFSDAMSLSVYLRHETGDI